MQKEKAHDITHIYDNYVTRTLILFSSSYDSRSDLGMTFPITRFMSFHSFPLVTGRGIGSYFSGILYLYSMPVMEEFDGSRIF